MSQFSPSWQPSRGENDDAMTRVGNPLDLAVMQLYIHYFVLGISISDFTVAKTFPAQVHIPCVQARQEYSTAKFG